MLVPENANLVCHLVPIAKDLRLRVETPYRTVHGADEQKGMKSPDGQTSEETIPSEDPPTYGEMRVV
jgi:hypothetical protein